MVFGWGKKKEERKPGPQTPQNRDILLSDVPKIASRLLELRESQTVSEIRSHRDQIVPLLAEVSGIGRRLEEDDLKVDDIDKHIRIIVVRGKKQVIDVIKKDIVDLPEVSTYEDAVSLNATLNQTLKKIGDTLGRQTRVIHIFAKKYAGKLKEILAEIKSGNDEIRRLLANYEGHRSSHAEINDCLEQISSLESFNSGAKQRVSSLRGSLADCESRAAACEEAIKKIKSSAEYAELLKLKETLGRFRLQKTQLSNKVLDHFTKISRPLGRYEYASSLDKEQKLLLSGLIRSPFNALTSDNKDTIIVILENVKKGILSGSVSVKDQEKSLSQITEIEEALDGLISEISQHMSGQAAAEGAIAELTPAELQALERDLGKLAADKSGIESRIRSLDEEMSANKSKIPRIVNDVEARLRRFSNVRYAITAAEN